MSEVICQPRKPDTGSSLRSGRPELCRTSEVVSGMGLLDRLPNSRVREVYFPSSVLFQLEFRPGSAP